MSFHDSWDCIEKFRRKFIDKDVDYKKNCQVQKAVSPNFCQHSHEKLYCKENENSKEKRRKFDEYLRDCDVVTPVIKDNKVCLTFSSLNSSENCKNGQTVNAQVLPEGTKIFQKPQNDEVIEKAHIIADEVRVRECCKETRREPCECYSQLIKCSRMLVESSIKRSFRKLKCQIDKLSSIIFSIICSNSYLRALCCIIVFYFVFNCVSSFIFGYFYIITPRKDYYYFKRLINSIFSLDEPELIEYHHVHHSTRPNC